MLPYPNIDPVAISLGPLNVHWYGLMYVIGIASAWWLAKRRTRLEGLPWSEAQVEDLIFYCAMGLIVGGRLGYVFFYNFPAFVENPMVVFRVWEGGMAFHGGLMGGLGGLWLFARLQKLSFFALTDFLAPYVPIGLFAGRIGNFINGELWGKPTDVSWAMVFPNAGPEARHPSQLYEAFLEGVVLFVVLHFFARCAPPRMSLTGLFMLFYGIFRFAVEFVRLPDAQLGYLAFGWLTMGQVLCLPMVVLGLLLLALAYRRRGQLEPTL